MENLAIIERSLAVIFGIVVLATALIALKLDWKSTGLENTVFKLMLALLALGALLGTLAGIGVLGRA
jgi:hypothetical protein